MIKKNIKTNNLQRGYSGKGLFLEEANGRFNFLLDVKSSIKNKKETIKKIRECIGGYFSNDLFKEFKQNKIWTAPLK